DLVTGVQTCALPICVEAGRIVVRPPTRAICDTLGVDPLRLIASGALLVACGDGAAMVRGLHERGIPAAEIGQLTDHGRYLVHPRSEERRVGKAAKTR